MTTIHQMSDGKRMAFMKGAPEAVLQRCTHILDEGGIRELKEAERTKILKVNEEMAQAALRVLGFAYREFSDPWNARKNPLRGIWFSWALQG